ncbi:MAG: hypothetical protein H7Y01_08235 [Ferruginibacter sp.]|nr:hypothetical protein [Chitinophagaceae bacterium]
MKKKIKIWMVRLGATALLITGLLVVIVLNPMLTYAGKTTYNNYTLFHNKPLEKELIAHLDEATNLIKTSEFYNPDLRLEICLNDGSKYPGIIQALKGRAFAFGFYNKVVLVATTNYKNNFVELNGYKWNLAQLLAHEMIHCLQFDKRGFWRSNPVAKFPAWKWEGYPEYVARQHPGQKDLSKNIDRLLLTEQTAHNNWIQFDDSTGTVIPYYRNWLLVQFCLDIKHMTYEQVLSDTTGEEIVRKQMMDWYNHQ